MYIYLFFPIDNLGFKLIYKLKIWTWKFNLCGKHHQRNSDKYGTDKIFYFRSNERVKKCFFYTVKFVNFLKQLRRKKCNNNLGLL